MAARSFEEARMTDFLWIGSIAMLLLVYLMYALLVPENF